MILMVGIVLLAATGFLIRENYRAEFHLKTLKATGPYEAVEATQIQNFLRRVAIAIGSAAVFICFAAALAPQQTSDTFDLLVTIIRHLSST